MNNTGRPNQAALFHLETTSFYQVGLFVIVTLMVVSGMIVMAMVVTCVTGCSVIVSGVSVVAVCRVIMLRFETGLVQPVLPNVSGL